ncbi:MAG: outer membrane beta-barrel protein [bacterium]|nr:outer membrane beta-barrel protein [bacterium]
MLALSCVVVAAGVALGADDTNAVAAPYRSAGRFYLSFDAGHAFVLDDHLVGDVHLDQPNGFDLVLGGSGGIDLSEHWGIELQGHGVESDVRSTSLGKLEEYSNITIVPAARFRWPLGGGRVVPYVTAGVGYAINDDNDQHKPLVKVKADDSTVVGSLAGGVDYFLSPSVAVGVSLHGFIFPDQDVRVTVRDDRNRIVSDQRGSFNQSSIALLGHVRVYPGSPASVDGGGAWLLADHGPFDTDERRWFAYLLGGHTAMFDHRFGGGVTLSDPGDFNATLGAGVGVNLDRHWGVGIEFFDVAPNVHADPYGKFTEIDNLTFLIKGRFRWPFLNGRLVPYATAGLGAGTFDLNDSRSVVDIPTQQGTAVTAKSPTVSVQATQVAAEAGVGLEYFLNHWISVGLAVPVYIYPDIATTVQRGRRPVEKGHANFSGVAPELQLKAYFN